MTFLRRYPVPSAFLLLSIVPLAVVLGYGRIERYALGWAALALVLAMALAVVPLRRRWAWWIIVAIEAYAVLSIPWEGIHPLAWALNIVQLALLLSPQMRAFMAERQVVSWQRSQR